MQGNISEKELFIKLEDVDVSTADGIALCESRDVYIEVLGIACNAGRKKIDDLKGYLVKGDIANYTILVHSIKSGLANIGALSASKLAKKLEAAGKENDRQFIVANHNKLIEKYNAILSVLEEYFGAGGETLKETAGNSITPEEWTNAMKKADYYADELEFDMLSSLADNLLTYELSQGKREQLLKVKQYAGDFDMENMKSVIEKLKSLN